MAYTQQLLNSLRKTAPSSASENAHQLLTSSTSSNWAASRMRFESTPSLASRREYHSENSDLHAILESQNEKISRLMNRNDALEMQIAEVSTSLSCEILILPLNGSHFFLCSIANNHCVNHFIQMKLNPDYE